MAGRLPAYPLRDTQIAPYHTEVYAGSVIEQDQCEGHFSECAQRLIGDIQCQDTNSQRTQQQTKRW